MEKQLSMLAKQILEGADIRTSLANGVAVTGVEEAEAAADKLDAFHKSSFYTSLARTAKQLLYKVENDDDYRKKEWAEDPLTCVHDEIEEFYYALEHVKSIKLHGFPVDVVKKVDDLLTTAARSYNRVLIKLKGTDTPEKVAKAFQPLFYSKKALTLLTDYFEMIGAEWDYTWPYYNTNREPNVKDMAFEASSMKKYFHWISGLYERYDLSRTSSLISEKRSSLSDEKELSAFNAAESFLK